MRHAWAVLLLGIGMVGCTGDVKPTPRSGEIKDFASHMDQNFAKIRWMQDFALHQLDVVSAGLGCTTELAQGQRGPRCHEECIAAEIQNDVLATKPSYVTNEDLGIASAPLNLSDHCTKQELRALKDAHVGIIHEAIR